MDITFIVTAAVAIAATALVITGRNAVHALLYLVVSLLAVAVMFLVLGAPFAAALEVIVYAGAIMVLFLFVVMMIEAAPVPRSDQALLDARLWIGPGVLAAILFAELLVLLVLGLPGGGGVKSVEPVAVGSRLLGPYLLAVELASMLLLAGVVGAWHLGRPARRAHPHPHPPAPTQKTGRSQEAVR
jgi:NADH-quinone oxidoreductase subunit J